MWSGAELTRDIYRSAGYEKDYQMLFPLIISYYFREVSLPQLLSHHETMKR